MSECDEDGSGIDPIEINVGYVGASGREAAVEAADGVVREFESLDVVTVRASRSIAASLGDRADVRYVEVNGQMDALDVG